MSDMYTGLYFVPVNPDDSSAGVRLVVPMPIVKAESLGDQVIGVDNTCELFAALRTFFETRGNQDRSNREGVATKTMLVQSLKTLQEDLGGFQVLVGLSGHASDDSVFSQLKRQADVYLAVLQDEDFSYDSGYVSGTSPVGSLLHGHGMVLNVELPDSVKKIKPKSGSFDAVKKGIGKELVKVLEDVVVVPNPSKRSLKEDDRRNKEQLLQSALKGAEKQLLADLEGYDTNKFSHTAKLIVLIEYYLSDFLSNLSRTPHAIGSYKKIQELVIKPFVSSLLSISLLKMPNEIKAELWIEKVMADIVCEDGSIRPAKVENISVIDSRLLEYEEAIKKSTPVKLPRSGKAEAVSSDQEEDACSASIELDDLIFCMQQTLWCKEEVFEDNRYRFLEFAYAQERSKAIGADMHGQYNVLMTKSANHLSLWVQFFFACLNQYVLYLE